MIRWCLIVVVVMEIIVTPAVAEQLTFVAPAQDDWDGLGDWHVAENWSGGQIPTEDDDVIIPTKTWCTIQLADDGHPSAICRTLEVADGAKLTNLENTLVVGSDEGPTVSIINGVVEGREPNGYPPSAKIVPRYGDFYWRGDV